MYCTLRVEVIVYIGSRALYLDYVREKDRDKFLDVNRGWSIMSNVN